MGELYAGLEVLFHNPFRVLGVPVDATAKTVERCFSRAKAQASLERKIEFDSDIPLTVEPERTLESIRAAKGLIEQSKGRLQHSLWWFWEGSAADEMAFTALRVGDSSEAVDIWTRVVDGKPVSDSNYSAVRNLGLYYLNELVATGIVRVRKLQKGLDLLATFIGSSAHFDKYVKLVLGSSKAVVDSKKLMQGFGGNIALLLDEALSRKDISVMNLGRYFEVFGSTIGDELAGKFIIPLERGIEEVVSQVVEELKDSPEEGLKLGWNLIETAEDNLGKLGVLLEDKKFKLGIIQEKVAMAVLRCGRAYSRYVTKADTFENPWQDCLELVSRTLQVCSSESVARKLEVDIDFLKERTAVESNPNVSEILLPVAEEVDAVNRYTKEFEQQFGESVKEAPLPSQTIIEAMIGVGYLPPAGEIEAIKKEIDYLPPPEEIASLDSGVKARRLIETCFPMLKKIYLAVGGEDQHFQRLSDLVAFPTLLLCQGYLSAGGVPSRIQSILTGSRGVGQLYMSSKTRKAYAELLERIKGA